MNSGLSIRELSSGYGDRIVVNDLSLEVGQGETLVMMGASGSGKSTLLLTILGILNPIHGKIFVGAKEITNLPIESRNIGYLPQDYGLFPHLDVMDNITYGLRVRGIKRSEYESRAEEMLSLVELQAHKSKKPKELSGGERQRVGLARALAIKPDLLLLDEPLSNVDQSTKLDVAKQMKELFAKLNIPVILVTHNHEDALFLAQRLAIMVEGKIEQEGTAQDVLKNPKTKFIHRLLMPFFEGD